MKKTIFVQIVNKKKDVEITLLKAAIEHMKGEIEKLKAQLEKNNKQKML